MSLKLMGKKIGMTRVYNDKGCLIVCTLILMDPNVVVQVKTVDNDGYNALQLGAVKVPDSKKRHTSKPLSGHFARAKIEPMRHLLESRIDSVKDYSLSQEISVDYFSEADVVDVSGVSKGKGFQGVIKRHGFAGGPASHGSGFHRSGGSTGMRSTPGRCLPGTKKPGQMGAQKVTVEGLSIVRVIKDKNILLLKGSVPGANGSLLYVRKSIKKNRNG